MPTGKWLDHLNIKKSVVEEVENIGEREDKSFGDPEHRRRGTFQCCEKAKRKDACTAVELQDTEGLSALQIFFP